MMCTGCTEHGDEPAGIVETLNHIILNAHKMQRRGSIGHSLMRMATTVVLVLQLRLAASNSTLSFDNQTITSSPLAYACGFYTMSYQLWCDKHSPVTSYVTAFNSCGLVSSSAAKNGGFSSLLNTSTKVLPSGLIAAASCPPVAAFAQSMSCPMRTDCTIKWPGPENNAESLCLILIAGPFGGSSQTACDLSIEGQTSLPAPAAAATSISLEDIKWWQLLLIVVAGLGVLLVGLVLLLCIWRCCCNSRRSQVLSSGGDVGGVGGVIPRHQVYPATKSSSFAVAVDKPRVLANATATAAATASVMPAYKTSLLPSELLRLPPAEVLRLYSQHLQDNNLDNPNLYAPDDKKIVQLGRPSAVLATSSTGLPGAVPGKSRHETDTYGSNTAANGVSTQLSGELVSELQAGTARPLLPPLRSPQQPSTPGMVVPMPQASPDPKSQMHAPTSGLAGDQQPQQHVALPPPQPQQPPPPPPPQQQQQPPPQPPQPPPQPPPPQQQQQPQQKATRSQSIFSRMFSKKQQPTSDGTAGANGSAASGSGSGFAPGSGGTGTQLQGSQPEGMSHSMLLPPQSQPQPGQQGAAQPLPLMTSSPSFPSSSPPFPSNHGTLTSPPNVQSDVMTTRQQQSQLQPQPPPLDSMPAVAASALPAAATVGAAVDSPYRGSTATVRSPDQRHEKAPERRPSSAGSERNSSSRLHAQEAVALLPPVVPHGSGGVPPLVQRTLQPAPVYHGGESDSRFQQQPSSTAAQMWPPPPQTLHPQQQQRTQPHSLHQGDESNADEGLIDSQYDGATEMPSLKQPLQPLRPPTTLLQPLQPLSSLRGVPTSASAGLQDTGTGFSTAEFPQQDGMARVDDGDGGVAVFSEPPTAVPVDPMDASMPLAPKPPRGLMAPLALPPRAGGLAPLPLGGGQGAGGGGSGGLAPLVPLPGPRKLAPAPRRLDVDDDDDDDDGGDGLVTAGGGGALSLRGESSFGDEREEAAKRRAGGAAAGGGTSGGTSGNTGRGTGVAGELADTDNDELDLDRPAAPRRGGLM